jgi:hypothetical protein
MGSAVHLTAPNPGTAEKLRGLRQAGLRRAVRTGELQLRAERVLVGHGRDHHPEPFIDGGRVRCRPGDGRIDTIRELPETLWRLPRQAQQGARSVSSRPVTPAASRQ